MFSRAVGPLSNRYFGTLGYVMLEQTTYQMPVFNTDESVYGGIVVITKYWGRKWHGRNVLEALLPRAERQLRGFNCCVSPRHADRDTRNVYKGIREA